jgi:NAD(P)-dependent dehydrogenase (short-subunit alcohol dehydrogenase family)
VSDVLITGSTDGLGLATARELSRRGARVRIHGRDTDRVRAAAVAVGAVSAHVADLSSLDDVRRLAEEVRAITVLVNNAGTSNTERRLTDTGVELTFQVNHLSGFLLQLLLVRSGSLRRVVNVASTGQHPLDFDDPMLEHGYHWQRAYRQSKLAQIMCSVELAERLGPAPTVNALHPGKGLATKMTVASVGEAGSMEELRTGVEALCALVLDPAYEGVTGRYFDRLQESRPHDDVYDPRERDRVWRLSEALVGERLG